MDLTLLEGDHCDFYNRVETQTRQPRLTFSKLRDVVDYFFEEPTYEYELLSMNENDNSGLEGGEDDEKNELI